MPSFSADERTAITRRLREAASRLFAAQGVRKTTLAELTGAAGVSKASFYSFYDSKEVLYVDLLLEQADEIARRIGHAAADAADVQAGIAALLREIVAVLETNPLYRRFLSHPDELRAVREKIGPDQIHRADQTLSEPLRAFVDRAQRAGALVPAEPAAVLGVLQATLLVTLHREDFDPRDHPRVLGLMIDTVAAGLTSPTHPAWESARSSSPSR